MNDLFIIQNEDEGSLEADYTEDGVVIVIDADCNDWYASIHITRKQAKLLAAFLLSQPF